MTLTIDNGYRGVPIEALRYPKAYGYGVRIGSMWFRLAVGPDVALNIFTQDSLAGREADQSNPYENVLDIGYAYARSNLTGGEGLDFFPREDPNRDIPLDETRYFSSSNIDVRRPDPAEPYTIRLARDFAEWFNPIETITGIAASTNRLYVAASRYVYQFNNYVDAVADATTDMGVGRTVVSIAADDADNAICVLDNGDVYYKVRSSSAWNQVTGSPAVDDITAVWMVKDRIMVTKEDPASPAAGVEFGELAVGATGSFAAPTFAPVYLKTDTFNADVMAVIDASTAILAATTDGYIRSYVPKADNAGDVPILTIRGKSPMPKGEYPYAIAHNAGTVVILTDEIGLGSITNVRAYASELLDERYDFVIGNIRLIREWGDVDHTPSVDDIMAGDRDDIWWIINETGNSELWRYDLVTTGLHRHTTIGTGTFQWFTKFYNRFVCSDGGSVYRREGSFQATGWLITPNINFGLNTDINWMSTIVQAENISGSETVDLYISTDVDAITDPDHPSWQQTSRLNFDGQTNFETNLVGIEGKTAALQLRLSGDTVETPRVTRMSLRGLPKHRDWILEIPINVSDTIEAPMRQPYRLPGWGNEVHEALVGLAGSHVEAQLFDPPFRFEGIVDGIMEPTTFVTYRGSVSRLCLIRLRGSRIVSYPTISNTHTGLGVTGLFITGR